MLHADEPGYPPRFTITSNVHEYNCVKSSFYRAGFVRDDVSDGWCAMWTKHLKEDEYAKMNPYQKVRTVQLFPQQAVTLLAHYLADVLLHSPANPRCGCSCPPVKCNPACSAAEPLSRIVESWPQRSVVPQPRPHAA